LRTLAAWRIARTGLQHLISCPAAHRLQTRFFFREPASISPLHSIQL